MNKDNTEQACAQPDSTPGAPAAPTKVSNFNVPNVLTSVRILFLPLFGWLLLSAIDSVGHQWGAFGLFVLLMITDKLDGDIARSRGLVTDFGKIADPIADKALVATALIGMNIVGWLPVWVTVVILVRELGITLWRMILLRSGKVVPASQGGKIKTTLQAVGIGMLLCPLPHWMHIPTMIVVYAAVLATVYTGAQYLWDSRVQK